MEGLAGVVYPEVFQVNHHVDTMLNALRHRKSEPRDIFSYKNLQIGITGNKIASNEKKTIYASLDGYIVNFHELSQDLKKHGGVFSQNLTAADLLVHCYELWGVNFFKQLSGDFAIVIFDQNKEKLILARDPLGKKPLYWFHDHRHFIFASELKALLASGLVPQTISKEAISAYLHLGYIPQDMAPIKDANKLLPGHYLLLNVHQNLSIQSYWSYSSYFENKPSPRKPVLMESLDSLMEKAFASRLGTSDFIGLFLSESHGSKVLEQNINKIGGHRQLFPYANKPQNDLNPLVQVVWHMDEPQADQNSVSLWHLAAHAAQKTPLVFSDLGYLEFFCSQDYYQADQRALAARYRPGGPSMSWVKRLMINSLNYIYEPLALKILKKLRTHSWQIVHMKRHALFNDPALQAAFPKLSGLFDIQSFLNKFHNLNRIKNLTSSLLYFDVKTHLVDALMLQMERMTAAHGLDWQTPFLDRHLVEFLARHPQLSDQAGHFELPAQFNSWFEFSEILPLLQKGHLVETGLLSEPWLLQQIKRYREGKEDLAFKHLWAILILELWHRLYIVRPITDKCPVGSVKEILMEK